MHLPENQESPSRGGRPWRSLSGRPYVAAEAPEKSWFQRIVERLQDIDRIVYYRAAALLALVAFFVVFTKVASIGVTSNPSRLERVEAKSIKGAVAPPPERALPR
jgi:hypothetical protein